MKTILQKAFILFLLFTTITGCEQERFDTELNIRLESGIPILKGDPVPIAIVKRSVEDNLISSSYGIIDTIYTDSFGVFDGIVSLPKLNKQYFYELQIREGKWFLPFTESAQIRSGIQNNITFNIEPKWRHLVTVTNTSNKYTLERVLTYHSKHRNYVLDTEYIDTSTPFTSQTFIASAPSHSYLFVVLSVIDNTTLEKSEIKTSYGTNDNRDIWIEF